MSAINANKALEREQKFLNTEALVYHKSGTSSELQYKVNTRGFIYKKTGSERNFSVKLSITCKLYYGAKEKKLVDTASTFLIDTDEYQREKLLLGQIKLNTALNGKYDLDVAVADLNGGSSKTWKLSFDRKEKNDVNYFYLINAKDSIPLFSQVLKPNTDYYLINNDPEQSPVRIEQYSNNRKLPPPIFSTEEEPEMTLSLDSFYLCDAKQSKKLRFSKEGIYKFYLGDNVSSTYKRGVLFHKTFPKVGDYDIMLSSMRFILNKDEYKNLLAAPNKQSAIENQWITFAGSKERAEKIIKSYYGRVEDANRDYSNTIEGWKTDRGLVKIIFGTPDRISTLFNREVWIYYVGGNYSQVGFEFYKEENGKEFYLNRSANFKDIWYYAVDTWRQGRPFLRD
jgi:GWxTD domain-containing protein